MARPWYNVQFLVITAMILTVHVQVQGIFLLFILSMLCFYLRVTSSYVSAGVHFIVYVFLCLRHRYMIKDS